MVKKFFILIALLFVIMGVLFTEKVKKERTFEYARYSFTDGTTYDAMTEATRRIIRSVRSIPDADVPAIGPDRLKELVDTAVRPVTIIDVRKYKSFQTEHIEGAISIPIAEIEKRYTEIPWEGEVAVVLYCGSESCPLSFAATKRLLALGFTNVMDLEGGLELWKEKGYPVFKERSASAPQ
ncbi:MAG: rhodanese-like domain-containing protein [Candidatus Omnitrophica bacterium]|nr:rhodanese-like domain-containing protein [Candidatus Omnitrophota bacterium]